MKKKDEESIRDREYKKLDDKLLRIGAKVVDELLLHNTSVEVKLIKSKGLEGQYTIQVDAHLVSGFSVREKATLQYRARRVELSEEGKRQLDMMQKDIESINNEIKKINQK